jgi:nicotinate-nucleotide pyrophosphorylase (carboxylating)
MYSLFFISFIKSLALFSYIVNNDTMKKAVQIIAGRAETECSGNVTKERLKSIAEIGVDFVSCGALTHSAMIMDVSLKNLTVTE